VSTQDTTAADFTAPGEAEKLSGAPSAQVGRLKAFLAASMPSEYEGRPDGEWPSETAIRLLQGAIAVPAKMANSARCSEPYCNQIDGHVTDHGIVNYDPRF
jgi:hypothetical protein